MQNLRRRWFDSLLAWYFVVVWGSGFVATKMGLQYAAPFTFLTLRYAFLMILASILAVNALHTLMRHGEAARVTSLMYLTPVIAVVLELLLFEVTPTPLNLPGIAVACLGVGMVAWQNLRRAEGH